MPFPLSIYFSMRENGPKWDPLIPTLGFPMARDWVGPRGYVISEMSRSAAARIRRKVSIDRRFAEDISRGLREWERSVSAGAAQGREAVQDWRCLAIGNARGSGFLS